MRALSLYAGMTMLKLRTVPIASPDLRCLGQSAVDASIDHTLVPRSPRFSTLAEACRETARTHYSYPHSLDVTIDGVAIQAIHVAVITSVTPFSERENPSHTRAIARRRVKIRCTLDTHAGRLQYPRHRGHRLPTAPYAAPMPVLAPMHRRLQRMHQPAYARIRPSPPARGVRAWFWVRRSSAARFAVIVLYRSA